MNFNSPYMLLLVVFIPLYAWFILRPRARAGLRFSGVEHVKKIKPSLTVRLRNTPVFIRCAALLLIILALARPQKGTEYLSIPEEGIDIVLAIDVSTSMLAEDFFVKGKRVNRLTAVIPVAKEFVKERVGDRIGIVVFAGRAYTQCPLISDKDILRGFLDRIRIGMVEDGTAIGSAIAASLNRIKDASGQSRVIVLLTDGVNNMGAIDPLTAAEMAKALEVKIYTIGVGTAGMAPYPVVDRFGGKRYVDMPADTDVETLTKIAEITGGMYFAADDTETLRKVYNRIDEMEKTEVESRQYKVYKELFPFFLVLGLVLLFLELLFSYTVFNRIP